MKTKKTNKPARTSVVVLGGAGAMGQITVRDLFETAPDVAIVVADYNLPAAKKLAQSYKSARVKAAFVDAKNITATAKLLRGSFAVINSVQYQLNVPVMKAALAANVHYLDLGGLFHVTRQQLKLHAAFKKKKLLALLGIGAAPGITNLLARQAADEMDEVHEIHTYVGSANFRKPIFESPLGTAYSLQTISEEASEPAAVFSEGKFRFVEAMSGGEEVVFPEPVGFCTPAYTLHSEVATLPLSYKKKGVREVSFRIAFGAEFTERLRFLRALGLLSPKPVQFGKAKIVPRDFILSLAARLPKTQYEGKPDEHEVVRAVVRGKRRGRYVEETVDCHVPGIPAWGLGVDVDTGCPPSVCVQLLLRGEISARGALPAELCVPLPPFWQELEKRGMSMQRQERPLEFDMQALKAG